jgi:hypothetical protein
MFSRFAPKLPGIVMGILVHYYEAPGARVQQRRSKAVRPLRA